MTTATTDIGAAVPCATSRRRARGARVLVALTTAALLGVAAPATAAGQFTLEGRGNGHGIGLSQYGAQSQALEGRSTSQILTTYYDGTGLAAKDPGYPARIGVAGDQTHVKLVVEGGTATVTFADGSAPTFAAAKDSTWVIEPNAVGGCRTLGPGAMDREGPCPIFDADGAARIHLYKGAGSSFSNYYAYGRDSTVEVIPDTIGSKRLLDVVVQIPLEQYLYGLAEMPYSWELEALKAQAIAGRSYAMHRMIATGATPDRGCSCHLYDSQQDQVYKGTDREDSPMWNRWQQAVDATKNVVVSAPGEVGTVEGVVQTFYSSSSNGRTESKHEMWGGAVYPYLVSVEDHWSLDSINPYRSWSIGLADGTVAGKVGLDRVSKVAVTARSASGAATEVTFSGVDNGRPATAVRTGSWVRSMFGLRSTTIEAVYLPPFTDDDGSPHEGDIVWLADSSITKGCTPEGDKFCPDAPVKRGAMAAFLVRALNLPAGTASFSDTKGTTFERDIAALARAGITRGCNPPSNTKFCPDEPVSRAQMATFLTRALNLKAASGGQFTDTSTSTHRKSIDAIAAVGITRGCNPPDNTRFCPDQAVTRAQMASFLKRALG